MAHKFSPCDIRLPWSSSRICVCMYICFHNTPISSLLAHKFSPCDIRLPNSRLNICMYVFKIHQIHLCWLTRILAACGALRVFYIHTYIHTHTHIHTTYVSTYIYIYFCAQSKKTVFLGACGALRAFWGLADSKRRGISAVNILSISFTRYLLSLGMSRRSCVWCACVCVGWMFVSTRMCVRVCWMFVSTRMHLLDTCWVWGCCVDPVFDVHACVCVCDGCLSVHVCVCVCVGCLWVRVCIY